jgi:hypothetical protein
LGLELVPIAIFPIVPPISPTIPRVEPSQFILFPAEFPKLKCPSSLK